MFTAHENHLNATGALLEMIAPGSVVKLQAMDDASEWEVTIVSTDEADPELNQISDECPVGEALLGRVPGDVVAVKVPLGTIQYRVVSVQQQGVSGANSLQ